MSKAIKNCHRCASKSHYDEDMSIILCDGCGFYIEQSSMTLDELIDYWNTRAPSQKHMEEVVRDLRAAGVDVGEFVKDVLELVEEESKALE